MGVFSSWAGDEVTDLKAHALSYIEVLDALTTGFILIAMMPMNLILSSVMPKGVRTIGTAAKEFPLYTQELLAAERASMDENKRSFISSLVKLADMQDDADSKRQPLSEEELQGNLFQFTLAGFDTTANTMAYAVATLAVRPDIQSWITKELDEVFSKDASPAYEMVFPKLIRCLALMHETLRLYTPVATISRTTRAEQRITTSSGTYIVPSNTHVLIDIARMHIESDNWGSDCSRVPPKNDGSQMKPPRILKHSSMCQEGAFTPWSSGARVCPGMKMAQVEFLAAFSTIFRGYKRQPGSAGGRNGRNSEAEDTRGHSRFSASIDPPDESPDRSEIGLDEEALEQYRNVLQILNRSLRWHSAVADQYIA